jgi:glucokinase
MPLTIGVDVGGTKVGAGVVDEQGSVRETAQRDSPSDDPKRTEHVIADLIRELAASHDVEAVGVGAAGFVDAQRSTVLFAPNLVSRDEPLRAAIEGRCRLPVVIENDANAAAWTDARFGAGRGEDHAVISPSAPGSAAASC